MNRLHASYTDRLTTGRRGRKLFASPPILKTRVAGAGSVRLRHKDTQIHGYSGHGGNWLADTQRVIALGRRATFFKEGNAVSSEQASLVGSCLTLNEVAVRLQVCRRTLEREIAAGRLPCLRIGRSIRVQESDLLGYLNNSRAGITSSSSP